MKKLICLSLLIIFVFSTYFNVSAMEKNIVFTMNSIKNHECFDSLIPLLGDGEVYNEFLMRLGLDKKGSVEYSGVIGEINPMKPEFILYFKGKFDTSKILNELIKEKNDIKYNKNDEFISLDLKKIKLILADNYIFFTPENSILCSDEENIKKTFKIIDEQYIDENYRFLLDLPEKIKDRLIQNSPQKLPAPVKLILKGIKKLEIIVKGSQLDLALSFEDEEMVNTFKSSFDTVVGLGRIAMNEREKIIRKEMKEVSAFKLLSPEIFGQLSGIKMGRKILKRLKLVESGKDLILKVNLPEKTMNMSIVLPVLAVTGIAAAIAIPNFVKAREKARKKACIANGRTIINACEIYKMENNKFPDNIGELVRVKMLDKRPYCPASGEYKLFNDGENYMLKCSVHGEIE